MSSRRLYSKKKRKKKKKLTISQQRAKPNLPSRPQSPLLMINRLNSFQIFRFQSSMHMSPQCHKSKSIKPRIPEPRRRSFQQSVIFQGCDILKEQIQS